MLILNSQILLNAVMKAHTLNKNMNQVWVMRNAVLIYEPFFHTCAHTAAATEQADQKAKHSRKCHFLCGDETNKNLKPGGILP